MNITKAQKIRLGIFMVFGITLLATAITLLAGLKLWENRARYTVRFSEEVGGLEVSAPVKYQGLRVGRVEDMMIASDDPSSIQVILSLDPRTLLFEGTKAVLERSGLTGLKTINLTPGDPKNSVISPGSIIPSGKSFVDKITGRAEEIALKVEIIANQLATWTRDSNRQRVEKLLDSLTSLSSEVDYFLRTNREPIRNALNGIAKVSGSAADIAQESNKTIVVVREEIRKTLEETRTTLKEVQRPLRNVDPREVAQLVTATKRVMTSLDQRLSSEQLGRALDGLLGTLKEVSTLIQSVDLSVRAGREDLVSTLSDLRQAAEDIREFSRTIAQDPSSLIRGKE